MQSWLILSSVALVFWGISGVTQKLATNNISFQRSFLWFTAAFFAQSGVIALVFKLRWNVAPSLVAVAALGGLLNGLGALTSFAALERGGRASVVIPLVSVYPLLTVAGAWVLLHERLSLRQWAGVFCALVAIVLLSRESQPTPGDHSISPSGVTLDTPSIPERVANTTSASCVPPGASTLHCPDATASSSRNGNAVDGSSTAT